MPTIGSPRPRETLATTFYDDPKIIADASRNLGEAMVGINLDTAPDAERFENRGW